MRAYDFLLDYFNEDEYFIIAQKHPMVDGKIKHHHTMLNIKNENLKKQLGRFYYLNKDANVDIYFTLNTYQQQNTPYPKRKEPFVHSIKSFYFDIDKGDVDQKKTDIINLLGHPTYLITSSENKYQFIYKFSEPLIVKNEEERNKFKILLKGLTYHFNLDSTFDTARVFRLVGYKNKKKNNDDFIVEIQKHDTLYNFADFEEIAHDYPAPEKETKKPTQIDVKPSQKTLKKKKTDITSNGSKFDKFKGIKKVINRKYKELVNKYNQDKSTADLAYARWLRTAKQIDDENVIVHMIFKARGYQELMEKHGYQIEYYIDNILEKSL